MDAQITILRTMHDKTMAAKTPAERHALLAEHATSIRNAMKVMNETPYGGSSDSAGDETAQRQMTEKRLEMMQIALQLTTDRLAIAPSK